MNVYFAYKSTVELVPGAALAGLRRSLPEGAGSQGPDPAGPCGSARHLAHNRKLSVARGQAVRQVLLQSGVDVPVLVRGYGDSRPLRSGRSERAFATTGGLS